MKEDGVYFLCPKCHKLTINFMEIWDEYTPYYVRVYGKRYLEYERGDADDGDFIKAYHIECDFETREFRSEDFLVKIIGNKIIPIGDYWKEFLNDLKKIARKIGKKVMREKQGGVGVL